MKLHSMQTNALTDKQVHSVKNLQQICFQYEGLENEPFLSNEMNTDPSLPCFFLQYDEERLVGFLAAFCPTAEEVEVTGFVHPCYRNMGIFSSLVTKARGLYTPLPFHQMLFQVESSCDSGKAYVRARFPHIDRSEYRLTLSKSRWQAKRSAIPKRGSLVEARREYQQLFIKTAQYLLKEDSGCIHRMLGNPERKGYLYLYEKKPVGVLQKCRESEKLTMLYGVAIDESVRGQGHGKAMLGLALDMFLASSEHISLEVDSQNPNAFGLYCALGFEIDFQVDYHSLILS